MRSGLFRRNTATRQCDEKDGCVGVDDRRAVALVTGGSSGIGRCTAVALAQTGWDIVLVARSRISLTPAERECAAAGAQVLVAPADVGDQHEVDAAFTAAIRRFGRIDAVVNAAAALAYGRFEDVPAAVFNRAITTNLLGTANVARAVTAGAPRAVTRLLAMW